MVLQELHRAIYTFNNTLESICAQKVCDYDICQHNVWNLLYLYTNDWFLFRYSL